MRGQHTGWEGAGVLSTGHVPCRRWSDRRHFERLTARCRRAQVLAVLILTLTHVYRVWCTQWPGLCTSYKWASRACVCTSSKPLHTDSATSTSDRGLLGSPGLVITISTWKKSPMTQPGGNATYASGTGKELGPWPSPRGQRLSASWRKVSVGVRLPRTPGAHRPPPPRPLRPPRLCAPGLPQDGGGAQASSRVAPLVPKCCDLTGG